MPSTIREVSITRLNNVIVNTWRHSPEVAADARERKAVLLRERERLVAAERDAAIRGMDSRPIDDGGVWRVYD